MWCGSWGREVGSVFPQLRASIWESCQKEFARLYSGEFHVHFRMFKSSGIRSSLEDEVAKKRTRLLGGLDLHLKCFEK